MKGNKLEEDKNPDLTWFKFEIDFQIPKMSRLLKPENADEILRMTESMLKTTANLCSSVVVVMLVETDETKREEWWRLFKLIQQAMHEYTVTSTKIVMNRCLPHCHDKESLEILTESLKKLEKFKKMVDDEKTD